MASNMDVIARVVPVPITGGVQNEVTPRCEPSGQDGTIRAQGPG